MASSLKLRKNHNNQVTSTRGRVEEELQISRVYLTNQCKWQSLSKVSSFGPKRNTRYIMAIPNNHYLKRS